MNTMSSEVPLPLSAENYIRRVIAEGSSIGKHLVESIDFRQGRTFALLPPEVTLPLDIDYTAGGIANSDVSRNSLTRLLVESTSCAASSVVVFENRCAQPDDLSLAKCASSHVALETEVYHYWRPSQPLNQLTDVIVESATAIETAGYVFNVSERRSVKPCNINIHEFQSWKCMVIIVTAFDGEGYLIWQQTDSGK